MQACDRRRIRVFEHVIPTYEIGNAGTVRGIQLRYSCKDSGARQDYELKMVTLEHLWEETADLSGMIVTDMVSRRRKRSLLRFIPTVSDDTWSA